LELLHGSGNFALVIHHCGSETKQYSKERSLVCTSVVWKLFSLVIHHYGPGVKQYSVDWGPISHAQKNILVEVLPKGGPPGCTAYWHLQALYKSHWNVMKRLDESHFPFFFIRHFAEALLQIHCFVFAAQECSVGVTFWAWWHYEENDSLLAASVRWNFVL